MQRETCQLFSKSPPFAEGAATGCPGILNFSSFRPAVKSPCAGVGGSGATPVGKRFRASGVYSFVATKEVRCTVDLQALAAQEAQGGDPRLAEFCTVVGTEKITQLIEGALAVLEAPKAVALRHSTRMSLL